MSSYKERRPEEPIGAASESMAGGPDVFKSTGQLDIFAAIDDARTAEARRLAAAGMARAEHSEDVRIASASEAEIRRLAAAKVEFTPDDVLPGLQSRKALGPVFSKLAREGVVRCVGAKPSSSPSRHGALTRIWIGTDGGGA